MLFESISYYTYLIIIIIIICSAAVVTAAFSYHVMSAYVIYYVNIGIVYVIIMHVNSN
jgi:hypothetical protein